MSFWDILKLDITARPDLRRYALLGFQIEPRLCATNVVGLFNQNTAQALCVNVRSGDIVNVAS